MLPLVPLGLAALSFLMSGGVDKLGRQFNDNPMDNPSFGDWAGTAAMTGLGGLGGLGPSMLAKAGIEGATALGYGAQAHRLAAPFFSASEALGANMPAVPNILRGASDLATAYGVQKALGNWAAPPVAFGQSVNRQFNPWTR